MIEITAEIRAWIDENAGSVELAADEYIDPADGLIHCKTCGAGRPRNRGTAWRVSSVGKHRDFKTAICMITPLPTTTGKTR